MISPPVTVAPPTIPAMDLDDIRLVSTRLAPSAPGEVSAAEAALGCRFPAGYAAYVERFGGGDLGHFLRVYPPERVLAARAEWQQRVTEYWFWDTEASGTTPEHLREGVVVADSFDGDELCFHPDDPDTLFVLPRNSDDVHRVGPGLLAALEWMLGSGELTTAPSGPVDFEPWQHRTEVRRWVVGDLEETAAALAAEDPAAGRAPVQRQDEGFSSTVVYLPAIGGRAMLWRFADDRPQVVLSHDEDAPADAVARVGAVLDRRAAPEPS